MADQNDLAQRFEESRARLRAVALRMLGSESEAEDAVQETWVKLSRTDRGESADGKAIDNLGGWLTTVLARVCLDALRARRARREDALALELEEDAAPASGSRATAEGDPERQAVLADSIGAAMLLVLDTLEPAERLAFVLHDMFAVSFEEIAPMVGKSEVATRQLASRARRRIQGTRSSPTDAAKKSELIDAFLRASRGGDFAGLLAILDPEIVVRPDAAALSLGALGPMNGADAVAGVFAKRARGAQPALVDGARTLVWAPGGKLRVVFDFTVDHGRIVAIDLVADPAILQELELEILAE